MKYIHTSIMKFHPSSLALYMGNNACIRTCISPAESFMWYDSHEVYHVVSYYCNTCCPSLSPLQVCGVVLPPLERDLLHVTAVTFTAVDDRRAVLFGGGNGDQGRMNDVYIIDLLTMVHTYDSIVTLARVLACHVHVHNRPVLVFHL